MSKKNTARGHYRCNACGRTVIVDHASPAADSVVKKQGKPDQVISRERLRIKFTMPRCCKQAMVYVQPSGVKPETLRIPAR